MKKSVCSVLAFLMLLSAMGFSGCGSGNGTWTSTGGSLSKYPITSLAYDGAHNVLYAGTRQGKGGVWKYDGTKWVSINKGIAGYGIYSLVYDSKHNMLYAGCWNDSTYSGGVWGYNGSTWINTGEGMSNNQVQSLAYDPTHNLLYAGCIGLAGPEHPETGSGLWKYDGTTWTFISGEGSKGGVTCLTYDSVHNFLYVNGSWKYDGTTWVFLGGGLCALTMTGHPFSS